MKNNPVGWFEIYVEKMDRAKMFYESVLKIKFEKLNSPVPGILMESFPMVMDHPGTSGALVKMDGFSSGRNSTLVYFSCEDCSAELSRIEPSGGKIERQKTPIGEYGFVALAYDSEGNMFGLHSQK